MSIHILDNVNLTARAAPRWMTPQERLERVHELCRQLAAIEIKDAS